MFLFNILFYFLVSLTTIYGDAPYQGQIGFQDPASPVMESISSFHDFLWFFLIFILVFVSYFLCIILIMFKENVNNKVTSTVMHVPLEAFWTCSPALVLSFIGGNSIAHMYSAEEILSPQVDIVIVGNQWYWTYEFMVFTKKITIESHMIEHDQLEIGQCRNYEVDNALVLPTETNIRLIVTSNDVIHCWAVPSLGIKIDAVPGRLNTGTLFINREGQFYGQCSEICGKGHGIMPI